MRSAVTRKDHLQKGCKSLLQWVRTGKLMHTQPTPPGERIRSWSLRGVHRAGKGRPVAKEERG